MQSVQMLIISKYPEVEDGLYKNKLEDPRPEKNVRIDEKKRFAALL